VDVHRNRRAHVGERKTRENASRTTFALYASGRKSGEKTRERRREGGKDERRAGGRA
jgi:hypothetical protein